MLAANAIGKGCITMSVLTEITRRFQGAKQAGSVADAPDALELIHRDHEECDALFATALSDSTPSAAKKAAIAKVCAALLLHARMEEAIFYPALRKAGKRDEKDSVLEAAEEHGMVKDMIAKIQRIAGRDETLEAKVTVLAELVHHHVKEEESTIFDEARKVLGNKLQALGEEMQRFKERAAAGNGGRTTRKKTRTASAPGRKKTATGRKKSGARR
jgi:hemerythrin superfamily protein